MSVATSDTRAPVALITGGGTGIGAGIARRLAESYRVAICGRRAEPLQQVTADTKGLSLVGDISVAADVDRIIAQAVATCNDQRSIQVAPCFSTTVSSIVLSRFTCTARGRCRGMMLWT